MKLIRAFCSLGRSAIGVPVRRLPTLKEPIIIKGIIGGILTLEHKNARDLFNLNKKARVRVMAVWNPQKGAIPQNIPRATEKALLLSEVSASRIFSLTNRLKLFFLTV